MVLQKVEGAGNGGGWISAEGAGKYKRRFSLTRTERSNPRARLARLGRRKERQSEKEREERKVRQGCSKNLARGMK